MTTIADGLYQYGGMPTGLGIPPFVSRSSKAFFVDPVNGSDGNDGTAPSRALASLYSAHYLATAGNNDVIFLIGTGAAAGSCRLSTANATASRDTSLTTGTLVWSKNATHLIGIAAPGQWARARIAAPTGTYTSSTFGSATFMSVTGSGCYFSNLSLYQTFSTGENGEICLSVTGDYNVFSNMLIAGMQSAAAASGANSRNLVLTGADDNLFTNCIIGTDTVTRSAANSSIQLATGSARNKFVDCELPIYTSAATSTFGLVAAAAGCDRYTLFKNCLFLNAMDSGSTALTGAFSLAASAGGCIVVNGGGMVGDGAANWGADATSLAQMYVDNVGGAATAGLMLNPT
jgi:hypothetical protein